MAKTVSLLTALAGRTVVPARERLQPARPPRPCVPLPLRIRFARLDCREHWPEIALWLDGIPCFQGTVPPPIVVSVSPRTLQAAARVSPPLSLFAPPRRLPRLGGIYEREVRGEVQPFAFVGAMASGSHASVRLMPLIDASDPRAAGFVQAEAARRALGIPLDLDAIADQIDGHRGHGQRVQCQGREFFLCGPRVELVHIRDVAAYRAYRDWEADGAARLHRSRQERQERLERQSACPDSESEARHVQLV